ncbi:MAG: Rieske 2Fe-2S domain-containing protein [Asticcacaulis sp.]|nr:Rieske 2Fe-2S domain-containing protein [Asticcacaulis sp.]
MDDGARRNSSGLQAGWYAVCRSRDLGKAPKRIIFNDQAYVLWRSGADVVARTDMCPHRGAPLSAGRVVDGEIICPYHGWRFDRTGTCRHMPALDGQPPAVRLPGLSAREGDGLVFAAWPGRDPLPDLPITPLVAGGASVVMTGEVATTLADFAENILDTTHTSVVHGGYLRGREGRRVVTPRIVAGDDWIEAHYPPAATPDGFMGRFIGGRGYHITDRFRAPNLTEVEYRQDGKVVFAVRFHLAPAEAGRIAAFAVMSVGGWLAEVKVRILQALFQRIIAEDRTILEAVSRNRAAFGRSPCYLAPQDLLRPGIDAILRRDVPVAEAAPVMRV